MLIGGVQDDGRQNNLQLLFYRTEPYKIKAATYQLDLLTL